MRVNRGQEFVSRGKLTVKQEEAIIALLTNRNTEEAARAANVGVRTLYRWLKDVDFNTGFRAARRNAFSQSVARSGQHLKPFGER